MFDSLSKFLTDHGDLLGLGGIFSFLCLGLLFWGLKKFLSIFEDTAKAFTLEIQQIHEDKKIERDIFLAREANRDLALKEEQERHQANRDQWFKLTIAQGEKLEHIVTKFEEQYAQALSLQSQVAQTMGMCKLKNDCSNCASNTNHNQFNGT